MKLGGNSLDIVDEPVCFPLSKFFLISELQEFEVAIFTLIAKIPNFSILLFIGVYGPKFTKLSTLVKHIRVCLP